MYGKPIEQPEVSCCYYGDAVIINSVGVVVVDVVVVVL